jgi:hypothetical protein
MMPKSITTRVESASYVSSHARMPVDMSGLYHGVHDSFLFKKLRIYIYAPPSSSDIFFAFI